MPITKLFLLPLPMLLPMIRQMNTTKLLSLWVMKHNTQQQKMQATMPNQPTQVKFRTYRKTELCKVWEQQGYCRFGENVRNKLIFSDVI